MEIVKIDAGSVKTRLTERDIIPVISDICKFAEPYAAAKSIELIFKTPRCGKTMPIDVEKVERIVLNLLSNAIKHTDECGKIVVRMEDRQEKGVLLSVEDTGEGIPEGRLRMLFDRTAQESSSPAKKSKGCGMGLILVKSYVEMLGGKITAISKVGEGSKFSVELPIIQPSSNTHINVYGLNPAKRVEMELSDLDWKH